VLALRVRYSRMTAQERAELAKRAAAARWAKAKKKAT
jgi:hypothetical protein